MKKKLFGKIFLKFYLPILAMMGIIFYFSSISGLRVVPEGITLEIFLRKAGHLGEFALLFWLTWRLFFYAYEKSFWKASLFSLIIVFLYAISDEAHQAFVPERSGKAVDVAMDMLGAFLGLEILALLRIKGKNLLKFVFALLLFSGIFLLEWKMVEEGKSIKMKEDKSAAKLEQEEKAESLNQSIPESVSVPKDESSSRGTPEKNQVNVPFAVQAPFGKWDEKHEEACEEASILMMQFYKTQENLTANLSEKEIQKLIDYQIEHYGDYKDSSANMMVRLAKDFYNLELKVIYNFSLEELKAEVGKGNPIILPAAGRKLGNPFFTPPGPLYHALVLIGYKNGEFIVNDPGTKRGEGYRYPEKVLFEAIHDFPGSKEKIETGRKAMVVFK